MDESLIEIIENYINEELESLTISRVKIYIFDFWWYFWLTRLYHMQQGQFEDMGGYKIGEYLAKNRNLKKLDVSVSFTAAFPKILPVTIGVGEINADEFNAAVRRGKNMQSSENSREFTSS